jgi:hypothetical protein
MLQNRSPLGKASLLVMPWLTCWVLPSPAQTGTSSGDNPYRQVIVTAPSPYWGYTYDPYGGLLRGAADLIRAQGDYLILREKAIQERVNTQNLKRESRFKEIEQRYREQELRIEMREKAAERDRASAFKNALTDPSSTEIQSARALNLLLAEMFKETNPGQGKSAPISAETLGYINTTCNKTGAGGNAGLLKRDVVPWSLLLLRKDFAPDRARIEDLLDQARKEIVKGGAATDTVTGLRKELTKLQARVDKENSAGGKPDWYPDDYNQADRSLGALAEAVKILQREDASYHLNLVQGKTVAEVVQYMKNNGLWFAPATTGGDRHYNILHRALAGEYNSFYKAK